MASGPAMCCNPARREDDRLPGYGGLGEGGGVAGARSPESRGWRARPGRTHACTRPAERGGAERGGGGGGVGVGVVLFVARTVRSGAGGRGKVPRVGCVAPARPRSPLWRISGSGHRRPVPRRAWGRSRGRAPRGRAVPVSPGRRGPPGAGSPPGTARTGPGLGRARSTGQGLCGRACRARPGPGLVKPAR